MHVDSVFDLSGKVVILTGGAGLLGREYALAMASMGARVVIADTNVHAGTKIETEISEQTGGTAVFIETDVANKSSVQAMVSRTMADHGQVDALINNAALDPKFESKHVGEYLDSFEDFPLERWDHSLAVNLTGMFLCAQAVAKPMLKRGRGAIVNISSIYGIVGPDQRIYEVPGAPQKAHKPVTYSVTKSAVLGLTRYLATYWAGKNIRVNSLVLGGVYNGQNEEFVRRYCARTPLARMANRQDYCGALLFLISDASLYMTGADLVVDGGWTAW